jgi:hypothetical protein
MVVTVSFGVLGVGSSPTASVRIDQPQAPVTSSARQEPTTDAAGTAAQTREEPPASSGDTADAPPRTLSPEGRPHDEPLVDRVEKVLSGPDGNVDIEDDDVAIVNHDAVSTAGGRVAELAGGSRATECVQVVGQLACE